MICGVDDEKLTREAQLEFCEADVRKLLASAVRIAKAGNGFWLATNGGYVVNLGTKERMEVREENGVCVVKVQFEVETCGVMTLDPGAGCNVWPKGRRAGSPRAEACSFPWSSIKLGFSQAEVSRAWCVGHVVRLTSDSEEVKAKRRTRPARND